MALRAMLHLTLSQTLLCIASEWATMSGSLQGGHTEVSKPYKIVISYRWEDSRATVDHIYDKLKDRFGEDAIFTDVFAIPDGYEIPGYIRHVLRQCRVVLIVIGRSWPTIVAKEGTYTGQPRLSDPEDLVRIEAEQALELAPADEAGEPSGDVLLIPLLVEGAIMPRPEQLPASLRRLSKRNAREIRNGPDFDRDVQYLIHSISSWIRAHASPLPPLGSAPAPANSASVTYLTPTTLDNLGFRGYTLGSGNGTKCLLPPICPVDSSSQGTFVFTMGSDRNRDPHARKSEMPQYPIEVDAFAIGQHPVTVAEYKCAVDVGAVRKPKRVRLSTKMNWEKQLDHLDHPVVGVSWDDAIAYAAWLAEITRQPWRLPTEAEWEKAARGTDGRIFPWGGDTFDATRCNVRESIIGRTTVVGKYPSGESPFHVQDMAGNVWEWTTSLYMPYPYIFGDGRQNLRVRGNRVVRGGSWFDYGKFARVAQRVETKPDHASSGLGFRLVWASD